MTATPEVGRVLALSAKGATGEGSGDADNKMGATEARPAAAKDSSKTATRASDTVVGGRRGRLRACDAVKRDYLN